MRFFDGAATTLTICLLTLKYFGLIQISWLACFSPLVFILFVLLCLMAALLIAESDYGSK